MIKDRLIFFGTEAFSVPSLAALIKAGYNVVAVVTKPTSRSGRGREITEPPVKVLANAHLIPVFQPVQIRDISEAIEALTPSAGVLVSYGKIIPVSILDMFPKGIINVHASLLPKYRGSSPIEAAILDGETKVGVSLMLLEAGMDTGPVYAQSSIVLTGAENKPFLYEKLSQLGAGLLVERLKYILGGSLLATPQDVSRATVVSRLSKVDATLDWKLTATQLERQIRAYRGWPGSRTQQFGPDIIVTCAHVEKGKIPGTEPGDVISRTEGPAIVCGLDILVLDQLKPAGKREMSGRDFMSGYMPNTKS